MINRTALRGCAACLGFMMAAFLWGAGPASAQHSNFKFENCANGLDDDGDGQVDCVDRDCESVSVCQSQAEICSSRRDEDGDGQSGCADPECEFTAYCLSQMTKIPTLRTPGLKPIQKKNPALDRFNPGKR